ncbi:hypothetical protein MTO96_015539 [Rhipicephalus appendiculatus]
MFSKEANRVGVLLFRRLYKCHVSTLGLCGEIRLRKRPFHIEALIEEPSSHETDGETIHTLARRRDEWGLGANRLSWTSSLRYVTRTRRSEGDTGKLNAERKMNPREFRAGRRSSDAAPDGNVERRNCTRSAWRFT